MTYAPAELLIIRFPGNKFSGEILPALADVVDRGLVNVLDIALVTKDADGNVAGFELAELDSEIQEGFAKMMGAGPSGLISVEDVEDIASSLEPESSVGLLLFEHTWAEDFAGAIARANGELVDAVRIPRAAIEEALATI